MGKIAALLHLGFMFLFKIEYTVTQCSSLVSTNDVDLSQYEWFAKYEPAFKPGDLYIYKFSSQGDLTMESAVSNVVSENFTCLSEHEVVPIKYFLYEKEPVGTKYCGSIFSYDNTLIMMAMAPKSAAQASLCPAELSGHDIAILGLRNHAFMDVSACSDAVPYREYMVEVSDLNENNQCEDTTNSTATMSSSGLQISTCLEGAPYGYAMPYIGADIQCAAVMSPTITGNNHAQGSVIIWRYQDRNDPQLYSFYCSFAYINTFANSILMSLDVTNEMLPSCRTVSPGETGYMRVNSTDGGTFIKFKLKANDCNPSKCLNGGVCTQSSMLNYTCACPIGFTGWRCETNIKDCSPSSCMNRGTCVDDVTTFSCRCPSFFTGEKCQWHTCEMHQMYANTWQSQINDTLGVFTITSGSDMIQYTYPVNGVALDFTLYCDQARWNDWFPVLAIAEDNTTLCFHFNIPWNADIGILFYKTLPPSAQYLATPDLATTYYPALENHCALTTLDSDRQYVSIRNSNPPRMYCPLVDGVFEESGGSYLGDEFNCTENATIYEDTIRICGSEMKCVAWFGAQYMWGEDDNTKGDILVWQDMNTNHIFCSRYKMENNWIKMSNFAQAYTDGAMDKYPYGTVCLKSTEYETMDEWHSYFYFRSNAFCKLNPCQNDGTCTTWFLQDYRCACTPRWYGRHCETYAGDIDECASSPCQNGGTCLDRLNKFECICLDYNYGDICQYEIDECRSMPCMNGGTCRDRHLGYACFCPSAWRGVHCEEYNNCHNYTCLNGGTCQDDFHRAQCYCLPGWSGKQCEMGNNPDYNECLSMPCQNGATCKDRHFGYACWCPPAWRGVHCQEYNNCHDHTCLNGGTCQDDFNQAHCFCLSGWSGNKCEMSTKPICDLDPCEHSGSCVGVNNSSFSCECLYGYTGPRCENIISECQGSAHGGNCNTAANCRIDFNCPPSFIEECSSIATDLETDKMTTDSSAKACLNFAKKVTGITNDSQLKNCRFILRNMSKRKKRQEVYDTGKVLSVEFDIVSGEDDFIPVDEAVEYMENFIATERVYLSTPTLNLTVITGSLSVQYVAIQEIDPCHNQPCSTHEECHVYNYIGNNTAYYVCNCENGYIRGQCQEENQGNSYLLTILLPVMVLMVVLVVLCIGAYFYKNYKKKHSNSQNQSGAPGGNVDSGLFWSPQHYSSHFPTSQSAGAEKDAHSEISVPKSSPSEEEVKYDEFGYLQIAT